MSSPYSPASVGSLRSNGSASPPPPPPETLDKLKVASLAQAANQSLGTYKCNESDSNYGNFLIPVLPQI
jgi:hypothetical protein